MSEAAGEVTLGWCAAEIARELPGLRLHVLDVQVARRGSLTGDSPPDVQERMRALSSSVRGARAIGVRREPVPAAYRAFFRHIGLDPDVERTPIETAVLERMLRGGFPSGGLLEDVLRIALIDTGVPVGALAGESLDGPLGIRASEEEERLGRSRQGLPLPAGRLVLADASAALAPLFGQPAEEHRPRARTRVLTLFAIQVAGVPGLYVEEALWSARTALEQP
jgi:DNA/RNA-binding domain of Phe-tRNA-synthetase-like protein